MVDNSSVVISAFQQEFSDINFSFMIKNIVFVGFYINDLLVRLLTATFKTFNIPFTSYHSTVIIIIVYMIGLYLAITLMQTVKPIIKWLVVILIIWMLLGFFKF